MSFDLTPNHALTYSTTAKKYGTACVVTDGGTYCSVASILPTNKTFRVRASGLMTDAATHVIIGQTGAFWIGQNSGFAFAQYGSGTNITTSVAINDGAYHDFDLRVSEAGAEFYVDGVLAGSSAVGATTAGVDVTASSLTVGSLNGSYSWAAGYIDEVAVSSVIPASGSYTPGAIANSETGLIAVWHLDGDLTNSAGVATGATATTMTGPTSGVASAASTAFTVAANGTITGTVVVTPNDGGAGGTFTPTTVSISSGTPTGTFTYTPSSAGAKTIGTTNNGSLSNPATITYTASSATATAITLSGPTAGAVGAASTNFTVGANGGITGTVVVTPSDSAGGGTFTPTSVSILTATPTGTFTYTAASAGAKTISVTNNGSLTNPSSIAYSATAGAMSTQVDTTDNYTAQPIMILVPSTGSAHPYNPAVPTGVILFAHGMGENQQALLGSDKATCVAALLDAGYILAGTDAHGANWGSQAAVDDYAALDKYMRANYNVSNVAIWSQSMGGHAGLLAIAQNKVKGVVGWLGTYPSCNLAVVYALGTYASNIDAAFGITGTGSATYANRTYGSDPVLLPAVAFKHVPMRFYASSGDGVIPKSSGSDLMSALVAGSTRESTVVACSGNHGDPSHFQPADYVSFFARCFATPVATVGTLNAAAPTLTSRTVSVTLKLDATTLAASLTGLKVSFWDEASPDLTTTARYQSAVETSDASGVLTFSCGSTLASGGAGYIDIRGSGLHYCAPVVVA